MAMLPIHRKAWLNFETIRILGTALYNGADVAEGLEAGGGERSETTT